MSTWDCVSGKTNSGDEQCRCEERERMKFALNVAASIIYNTLNLYSDIFCLKIMIVGKKCNAVLC